MVTKDGETIEDPVSPCKKGNQWDGAATRSGGIDLIGTASNMKGSYDK